MSKKGTRALASATLMSLVLTTALSAGPVKAAAATRIAGADRYATAATVATTNWTTSDNVVLVNGENYPDAVSASALAKKLNAPILLTTASSLNADTSAALSKLGAKNIYVVGGTASVSQSVRDSLKASYTLTELSGANRYETNVAVAKELVKLGVKADNVLVVGGEGFSDALSVAPVAAAKGQILLLANNNDDSMKSVIDFVKTNNSKVTVVGTVNVISDTMRAALNDATRINGGADRFDTNLKVLDAFKADLKTDNLYVANASGNGFADALVASALAGKTAAPLVLVDSATAQATTNAIAYVKANATDKTVLSVVGGTGVISDATVSAIDGTTPTTGSVSVSSITLTGANTVKVTFSQAPADTSKVAFTVSNGSVPVTVTATWNDTKTEATLVSDSKLPTGTYTVNVKNDATDLGSTSLSVSAEQKVATIKITSTKLGVTTVNGVQKGYATYKVLDQYGADITASAMANNIQFQTGVGTCDWKNGLLTIIPSGGLNLLTFGSGIVVTANDTSTGAATTANLEATSQVGTLSDIQLTKLTNVDNKVLTAGDTTDVFYAEFTATDISGNPTSNYTLLKQGLILDSNDYLTTSVPSYVTAQLVQDPTDSTKGLIEVRATNTPITLDMPAVITAMTWTGKTSQINTTLKKQSAVDTFTLMSPTESIASGESKEIPFVAKDQDGNPLTKGSDLKGIVNLTGAHWVDNLDGTVSVYNDAVTNNNTTSVPAVISATTPTGKYSSITVNIQKPVTADTLSLDTSVLNSVLQSGGATETADFGWNNGGFIVKDQYGRVVDMTTAQASNYAIVATSSDTRILTAQAVMHDAPHTVQANLTTGKNDMKITSVGVGSATVRFDLVNINDGHAGTAADPHVVVDSKSQVFTVVKNDDIKDYTIDTVANPIYNGLVANGGSMPSANTAAMSETLDYAANPEVYGTTSTGAKVVLAGTPILSAASTSGDFLLTDGNGVVITGNTPLVSDDVNVVAKKFSDPAKTEGSTTLSVTLMGADGNVHTVTTAIKSSTAKPAPTKMSVKVATYVAGISKDDNMDVVTLATGSNYANLIGSTLAKYDVSGNKSNIYFAPVDQYGKTSYPLSNYAIVPSGSNAHAQSVVSINPSTGAITYNGSLATGDYFTVSGTTINGLVKTVKIVCGNASSVAAITAAVTSINGGTGTVADYTTIGETTVTTANLSAVNAAVAAAPGYGTLTQSQISTVVASVAAASSQAAALAAVNNATDVTSMEAALANTSLGLLPANVTVYNGLTPANKAKVAQDLLTNMPGTGWASAAAIDTELSTSVTLTGLGF